MHQFLKYSEKKSHLKCSVVSKTFEFLFMFAEIEFSNRIQMFLIDFIMLGFRVCPTKQGIEDITIREHK